jgi:hypothetical protein
MVGEWRSNPMFQGYQAMSEPNTKLIKTKATIYRVSGVSDTCEYAMSQLPTYHELKAIITPLLDNGDPEHVRALYRGQPRWIPAGASARDLVHCHHFPPVGMVLTSRPNE